MNRIVVWGTGRMADRLMHRIEARNQWLSALAPKFCLQVEGFLDSDRSKEGTKFFGKRVKTPLAFDWTRRTARIVVAVKRCDEILARLQEKGLEHGRDYLTLDDAVRWLYADASVNEGLFALLGLEGIHRSMKQAWILAASEDDVVAAMEGMWSAVQHALEEHRQSAYADGVQQIWIYELLLSEHKVSDVTCIAEWLTRHLGASLFAEMLEACFDDCIEEACHWMHLPHRGTAVPARPETIGIYYRRMYNGGVERVLSKLIPVFVQHGRRVVLFTDVIDEAREYPLPTGVIRVVLGEDAPLRARCERILSTIREHHVDVYCTHANDTALLYELSCVQQAGIPVILEHHNIFSALPCIMGRELRLLCRRMDAVVTLSRTDAMFWRLLGCRSMYIPNPVDPPVPLSFFYDADTILWLQRVEQVQKQVLDLPEILQRVVAEVPHAKLCIVGASDTAGMEDRLKAMFEERGLSDRVIFAGYHTDVEPYYRKAAVMLMTSAYEGFPMTMAESKKYGVPLVLYDLPYLELLKDGRGYVAVPQHDKAAAADALVRILKDASLREKLSKEAQQSLADFCRRDLMAAWEKAFDLATGRTEWKPLTEEEATFSEIEGLLLDMAARERSNQSEA